MACELVFECDECGAQVVECPLAGNHPELKVWVRYPDGWTFDDDGNAQCPKCSPKVSHGY